MATSKETSFNLSDEDVEMSALEWVDLQHKIDQLQGNQETFLQKAKRRTLENPIAPLGMSNSFDIQL